MLPHNHWVGLRISKSNGLLSINGMVVPIDKTVFTERGGNVEVIERLIVHQINGVDSQIVFPIAAELHQHGVAITRDIRVIDNMTLYAIPL